MRPIKSLQPQLEKIDGKDYGAYQSLCGSYRYPDFDLLIERIPKDPYAPPHTGVYRVRVNRRKSGFPDENTRQDIHRIAFCDYLARVFYENCKRLSPRRRGTGNSGIITLSRPSQAILRRTSMIVTDEYIEARIFLGMPANNRSIDAGTAEQMLFEELPAILRESLFTDSIEKETLLSYLHAAEDANFLRRQLDTLGLVAFIADGSILPRRSGSDDRPLDRENVLAFQSPESLRISINLPQAGRIHGMGIPRGVTLLVGGGYHGKSTLLQAIEQGVFNHIPGDGRERCVSLPGTVKVRAYSGRPVTSTDISSFIQNIPRQMDTSSFSTTNASGSTSQAASIAEAIEVGANLLLMDEDTCATNFLIRDQRMQNLVKKENEPITAFIDRVRQLYDEHGISTVLVLGGSGDYLDVADHVIQMKEFLPCDVTGEAKRVIERFPSERAHEGGKQIKNPRPRIPLPDDLEPINEHGHRRIYAPDVRTLMYGKMTVDLADVEQLLEPAQLKAIGLAIEHARKFMNGRKTLREVIECLMEEIERKGLDLLDPHFTGDLVEFRGLEYAAVLNRMREFSVQ